MQKIEMSWAWIAGFFEGEGCIMWYPGKLGTKQGKYGRLLIGQKKIEPLQQIKNFLDIQGIESGLYQRKQKDSRYANVERKCWILAIQNRDGVIKFLENVNDMLIQKRDKGLIVLTELVGLRDERNHILDQVIILRNQSKSWPEVCNILGIKRRSMINYARSKGIDLLTHKERFDPKKWRDGRVSNGNCRACGKPRDGRSKYKCNHCIDQYNEYKKTWRKKRKAQV